MREKACPSFLPVLYIYILYLTFTLGRELNQYFVHNNMYFATYAIQQS